jgi:elongator complex protein 2
MTLLGHQDIVTSVAWVSDVYKGSMEHRLVSGSADGSIVFWKVDLGIDQNGTCPWEKIQMFECHHGGPVTCVTVDVPLGVVITTGGDGCVTAMISDSVGEYYECQRLSFGTKLVHCASITHVDERAMLLALGFVDGSVQMFASSGEEVSFSLACNLSGHQNWIRGLDFAHVQGGRILLASGSQDRYVRVWSIDASKSDLAMSLDSLGITKYAPKPRLYLGNISYDVILESLLVGHEDWVMSVAWNAAQSKVMPLSDLTLLSSSMDRTMILWKKDVSSGMLIQSRYVKNTPHCSKHPSPFCMVWGVKSNAT